MRLLLGDGPSLQEQAAEWHWAEAPLDVGDDSVQSAVVVVDSAGFV